MTDTPDLFAPTDAPPAVPSPRRRIDVGTGHAESRRTESVTQTLFEGDCLTEMRKLPDRTVKAIVTSPPYNLGKKYNLHRDDMPEADYLVWQGQCAREIARILHSDGHLFLNVGSDTKHPWNTIEVAKTYGRHLILQQTIIWVNLWRSTPVLFRNRHYNVSCMSALSGIRVAHFQKPTQSYVGTTLSLLPDGSFTDRPAGDRGALRLQKQPARFGHTAPCIAGVMSGMSHMKPNKAGPTAIITRRRFPSNWQRCACCSPISSRTNWR